MKLILCDPDPKVLEGWRLQFLKHPQVEIREGDPLGAEADALLLPGNSFGFLDGGLELRVCEAYGWDVQDDLRDRIRSEFDGEILVGQAAIIRKPSLPRPIVYAPIWRTPGPLSATVNVFLAVRGAFLAMKQEGVDRPLASLVVPAMGVAPPGGLDPRVSARQIRYAWEMAAGLRGLGDKNLSQLTRRQRKLQSIPAEGKEESED